MASDAKSGQNDDSGMDIDTDQSDDGILKRIEEAITNRTKAIIMSHIQYSCGLRMPIKKIVDLVQTKGILTLVDGAQTAGHIAVDVKDLGCDIYSIPGQKWLLGPDGTGALYIKQSMIPELIPYYTNSSSCNIDSLQGSTASTPIRAGFLEAIRFIEAIGIENIEARNLKLAASLKNKLLEIPGVTVTSPMDASQSSGLVTFTISDMVPKEFVSEIWQNSRILIRNVSYRTEPVALPEDSFLLGWLPRNQTPFRKFVQIVSVSSGVHALPKPRVLVGHQLSFSGQAFQRRLL